MQTALDIELFPDLCEVVEMPLHNQWVYLIQKNGNRMYINEGRDGKWENISESFYDEMVSRYDSRT